MIDDFQKRPEFARANTPQREDFMPDLSDQSQQQAAEKPSNQPLEVREEPTEPTPDTDDVIELDNATEESAVDSKTEFGVNTHGNKMHVSDQHGKPPKKPKTRRSFVAWFKGLSKKQRILLLVLSILVASGVSFGAYALLKSSEPPAAAPVAIAPEPEPEPTTLPNTLTGRQVDPAINNRQVIGVVIENSMEARPQSGLQEAGVVFEAIAEGGITRFLALYQDTEPAAIGPIRSARPYFVSWLMGFDAAIAHVGGSPEALQNIRSWGTKDLDQSANSGAFQRVTYRYAPHNVYSSYEQLQKLAASKNYIKSTFTGFERTEDEDIKPSEKPTATKINVNISSQRYNSSYVYDPETNTYARSMGGVAHSDEKSKKRITPDVVIVMVMSHRIHSNRIHSIYNTVGTGKVFVFQNGTVTQGTWQKTANESNIVFRDGNGRSLPLNPGQTWITAVGDAGKVTYKP